MASTYLTRAETDPASSNTTGTYSVWVKRGSLGSYQTIFNHRLNGSYEFKFIFYNDDTMFITANHNGVRLLLQTNRKFTDTNGWYHICIAVDSTQGSSTDRAKLYINGVQETSFVSAGGNAAVYPSSSQGLNLDGGSGYTNYIGSRDGSSEIFDGCMSHFHHVDGSALAPTVFGSTDSTTGEWKINTSPSYTVGTKGFFILKDGNSVTDQSANSNNFTVAAGTLTKTEDNPSNVFCTFNPLNYLNDGNTYANGNTHVSRYSGPNWRQSHGTLGITKGKFYWEVKYANSNDPNITIGIKEASLAILGQDNKGGTTNGYNGHVYTNDGHSISNNTSNTSYGATLTNDDIVSVAFDADNMKLYFAKNGTWQNSGVPTSGSTGTGAISVTSASGGDNVWLPSVTTHKAGAKANFGNGFFVSTAVASAGTNASGLGIFEYDVPTNYTALCTKGLNE